MEILFSVHHIGEKEKNFADLVKIGKRENVGSAGIKIARIAESKGDIYVNSSGKSSEWDTCAGALILWEAGGKITDMDGNDLIYNNENPKHSRGYVVSNGMRHEDIIKRLIKTL